MHRSFCQCAHRFNAPYRTSPKILERFRPALFASAPIGSILLYRTSPKINPAPQRHDRAPERRPVKFGNQTTYLYRDALAQEQVMGVDGYIDLVRQRACVHPHQRGLLSQATTLVSMPRLIDSAFLDRKHYLQDAKPDTVLSDELDPSMLLHINQRLKN